VPVAPALSARRRCWLRRYLRDLERLEAVINRDLAEGDQTAARAVREMIETVTIMPTPAGSTPGYHR